MKLGTLTIMQELGFATFEARNHNTSPNAGGAMALMHSLRLQKIPLCSAELSRRRMSISDDRPPVHRHQQRLVHYCDFRRHFSSSSVLFLLIVARVSRVGSVVVKDCIFFF